MNKVKMYGKLEKVFRTTSDGYINVVTSEMTYRFKGWELVPNRVKKWLKNNMNKYSEVTFLSQFSYEE